MTTERILLFSVVIKLLASAMFNIFGSKKNGYAWYILVVFTICLIINSAILMGTGNDFMTLVLFTLGIDNVDQFQHKNYNEMQKELDTTEVPELEEKEENQDPPK